MESILNYKEEDLVLDIDEGVNDPGIFKAIILAGGPGSGKSYVAKQLGLKSLGLIVVNSDSFFEMLMKRKGLSLKMPDNETEDREAARVAAKGLTDKRFKSLIDARMGIIVDSTSGDQGKTFKMFGDKNMISEIKKIDQHCNEVRCEVAICPPFPLILSAYEQTKNIQIGAQNCHTDINGAHTGEVSAEMLTEVGAQLIIVGHSERRQDNYESNDIYRWSLVPGWEGKRVMLLVHSMPAWLWLLSPY